MEGEETEDGGDRREGEEREWERGRNGRNADCYHATVVGRVSCLFSALSNKQMERLEIRVSPVRLFTCCSASPEGN